MKRRRWKDKPKYRAAQLCAALHSGKPTVALLAAAFNISPALVYQAKRDARHNESGSSHARGANGHKRRPIVEAMVEVVEVVPAHEPVVEVAVPPDLIDALAHASDNQIAEACACHRGRILSGLRRTMYAQSTSNTLSTT
jgi:hypothetical protein